MSRPESNSLQIVALGIELSRAGDSEGYLSLGECILVEEGLLRRPEVVLLVCVEKHQSLGVPRKQMARP